jgi:hypothetical protein
MAGAVQHQTALLVGGLGWYEPHVRGQGMHLIQLYLARLRLLLARWSFRISLRFSEIGCWLARL